MAAAGVAFGEVVQLHDDTPGLATPLKFELNGAQAESEVALNVSVLFATITALLIMTVSLQPFASVTITCALKDPEEL